MLTNESHYIVSFLLDNYKIPKVKLPPICHTWLTELFHKIKNIKTLTLNNDNLVQCSTLNQTKYYQNRFIAKSIQDDIYATKECQIYKILNTTIVIGKDWLHKINLQHIANIISIMRNLSGSSDHILINIWNTPHKKNLPTRCSKLEPININSGSTLPGQFINIWRNEELYKVLIHELIHTFFLDFRDSCNIENYIRTTFSISPDSPVYIWESYTEFLANIIHAIYISKTVESAINILTVEKHFGYLQCAKILNQFGCNSVSDLKDKKCTFKYITDVLSYFNIKTSMLHSLEQSILYMKKNNINYVKFNERKCSEYLKLIDYTMNEQSFIEKIEEHLQNIQMINDQVIKKTLRMTAIEIK